MFFTMAIETFAIRFKQLACLQRGRIEEFTSPLFKRLKGEISRQSEFQIRVTRL